MPESARRKGASFEKCYKYIYAYLSIYIKYYNSIIKGIFRLFGTHWNG
jgi:hypothetical protein